jgi:competence protein ComFC
MYKRLLLYYFIDKCQVDWYNILPMKIIDVLLNILFPPRCAFCKREGGFLCNSCIKKFKIRDLRFKKKSLLSEKEWKYLDGVIYGLDYAENPQIQAAIQQFKYKFTQELKGIFGDLISDKLKQLSIIKGRKIILIPVPLHKKRYYKRGFNQAYLIAKAVQERMGGRIDVPSVLKRDVNTPQQAKLDRKERHKNLKGAFSLNTKFVQDFDPKSVYFIVDDVCTTGTTLESCAKVLKEEGISRVYGLVVARALKQK